MLHGDKVTLRGRLPADVEVLTTELFEDVDVFTRAAGSAWRPLVLGQASLYGSTEVSERVALFSVVERGTGELLGASLLWGIDLHNRNAHIGLSLRPASRGRGFGTDTVAVLCRYAFSVLGLHRLGIETLADNDAMRAAAERNGFVLEGRLKESSWVDGAFRDDLALGLLASDWAAASAAG